LEVQSIVQFSSSVAALHISWLFVVDTEGTFRGEHDLAVDSRSGQPPPTQNPERAAKVQEMVARDRQITQKVEEKMYINQEIICQVLHKDLGMRKTAQSFFHSSSQMSSCCYDTEAFPGKP
jgi:hypothetical protein